MTEPVAWMQISQDGILKSAWRRPLTNFEREAGYTERALVYADDLDAANKRLAELEAAIAQYREGLDLVHGRREAAEARIAELEESDQASFILVNELAARAEAAEARIAELEAQLTKATDPVYLFGALEKYLASQEPK